MQEQWWHGKVAYQIYPKSFKDSNNDGIGDIQGIISKLDYLKSLDIDLLWISPIYVSPFKDQGYDIADYQNIDPIFGSMTDFEELLTKAKALDIGIIMDLVINHCSNEHIWFKRALADLNSQEASYFYFKQGKDGKEPDNLRSYFGGSVWEKVPNQDNLYYLHYFTKEQPDLNWFNEDLRNKLFEMMNWWLDKGIAGFRVDAIMNIYKDLTFPGLSPDDIDGRANASSMTKLHADKVGTFLHEMNTKTLNKYNAFSIGEAFDVRPSDLDKFIGDNGYFSSIFDLSFREILEKCNGYYQMPSLGIKGFKDCIFTTQQRVNDIGFVAPIIENHDEPRGVSYWLPYQWQNEQGAKALGTVNVLLRGIPFIYQGQELGMTNTRFNSIYEFDDVNAKSEYQKCIDANIGEQEALDILNKQSRDQARVPMPWDDSLFGGFSKHIPWIKVHHDYQNLNVKKQEANLNSTLNYYRRLIKLRKSKKFIDIYKYGKFEAINIDNDNVIAYSIAYQNKAIYVIANFDAKDLVYEANLKLELSSNSQNCIQDKTIYIKAGSAVVLTNI